MKDFALARQHLAGSTTRSKIITNHEQWVEFKKSSQNTQWIYLYHFKNNTVNSIIAWGTSTNSSDRIRKASLLNPKLTGKYDRRVDYLMLKEIYGMPEIFVFEAKGKATEVESVLKNQFGQKHCFRGIAGSNREEIARNIVREFQTTSHYLELSDVEKSGFERFLDTVYFAKRRHPINPTRTFFWGDCLEPGFLRTIGESNFEPVIEKILKVRF